MLDASALFYSLRGGLSLGIRRRSRPHHYHHLQSTPVSRASTSSSLNGRSAQWPIEPSCKAKSAMRLHLAALYFAAGLCQVQAHHGRHHSSNHGEHRIQQDSHMAPAKRVAIIGRPFRRRSSPQSLNYNTIYRRRCRRNLCGIPSPQIRRFILHPA
jgi:hypothetical protein